MLKSLNTIFTALIVFFLSSSPLLSVGKPPEDDSPLKTLNATESLHVNNHVHYHFSCCGLVLTNEDEDSLGRPIKSLSLGPRTDPFNSPISEEDYHKLTEIKPVELALSNLFFTALGGLIGYQMYYFWALA